MENRKFRPEVLQLAIDDHDILAQFTANMSKMIGAGPRAEGKKAVEAMSLLINKKILNHFAYEEGHVFSPLLANRPNKQLSQLVAGLRREHEALLKKIGQLNRTLSRHDRGGDEEALKKALRGFLTDLEEHASKEDTLFHSLLEERCPSRKSKRVA